MDAMWFVVGNAFQFTVVALSLGVVSVAYSELFNNWSLNLQPIVGFWGLAIFAFIATDALAWVTHWCHHKVPTLWRFHAVHHSQQTLSALSDNRTHVGEVVLAALLVFIPSQMLGLQSGTANTLAFIGLYYSAMLHSNIRTNAGPLKYIFMGPQAHRVHHSVLPQHYDTNFGTVFSWWDFLASTMYKGYNEYPPTGITDGNFPLRKPQHANPLMWGVVLAKQTLYPFQGIVDGMFARKPASQSTNLPLTTVPFVMEGRFDALFASENRQSRGWDAWAAQRVVVEVYPATDRATAPVGNTVVAGHRLEWPAIGNRPVARQSERSAA